LPSRDGSERVRRRRKLVEELPPPTPSPLPVEPEPVRVMPPVDPNPLFQMAAAEEPEFDPVHPLPERPKKERRKKTKAPPQWQAEDLAALSAAWQKRFADLRKVAPQPTAELSLPDYWPVANLSTLSDGWQRQRSVELKFPDFWPIAETPRSVPVQRPAPAARTIETFEVLAFRHPTTLELVTSQSPAASAQPAAIILSPAQPTPKHLTAARERKRFTWESPEMYSEED